MKILSFFKRKYFIIIVTILILYVFSWFFWLAFFNDKNYLISNKKVFVFNYSSGYFTKEFADKTGFEIVNIEKILHGVYFPVECIASIFNTEYIGVFNRKNFEILKLFNGKSNEHKLNVYKNLIFPLDAIVYADQVEKIRIKFIKTKNDKMRNYLEGKDKIFLGINYLGIFVSDFKQGSVPYAKNFDHAIESLYYNFREYDQVQFEINKFSNWFNNLNITENNSNFDKEFVKEYRAFIKEEIQ